MPPNLLMLTFNFAPVGKLLALLKDVLELEDLLVKNLDHVLRVLLHHLNLLLRIGYDNLHYQLTQVAFQFSLKV